MVFCECTRGARVSTGGTHYERIHIRLLNNLEVSYLCRSLIHGKEKRGGVLLTLCMKESFSTKLPVTSITK